MTLRLGFQKSTGANTTLMSAIRSWAHVQTMPPPLVGSLQPSIASPPLVLPEPDPHNVNSFGFGSFELMAVPKKKVSPHKRGIRNGPKALKPTPVIIRCRKKDEIFLILRVRGMVSAEEVFLLIKACVGRSCGRVKLPHFYCCSGEREKTGEQSK